MPELPEVETTRRGIKSFVEGQILTDVEVRQSKMRWPIPIAALDQFCGSEITRLERRAKYLLFHSHKGVIILHLGMSGSLSIVQDGRAPEKHDHVDLVFGSAIVRFNDPRRFGCVLVSTEAIENHPLIRNLGPEPMLDEFSGDYLFAKSRKKSKAIKNFIMDGGVVVGVGNIYASEALFAAGIRPTLAAGKLSRARHETLAQCIKQVLGKAIEAGGTTLNDFTQADGKPGYFRQELQVYGRQGEPCYTCETPIKSKVIGQRNTFFCTACQSF